MKFTCPHCGQTFDTLTIVLDPTAHAPRVTLNPTAAGGMVLPVISSFDDASGCAQSVGPAIHLSDLSGHS